MYFASFGVLACCRSLSEKLRFWGKIAKKAENSNFKEMGSSPTLLSSSVRAYNSPQPTTMCRKGVFESSELELTPVELERTRPQQPSAHQDAP
jgi:hypothetical protein